MTGEELLLERGTQALVGLSTMQSLLRELPPSAYDSLLVVSASSPTDVAEQLSGAGADLSRVGQIPISGSETEYDGPMWVCQPLVPDDLTGLSMRLSRAYDALDADSGWIVFENLNVFLMYADEARVVRFLTHTTTKTRERGFCGVYGVVRDAVDEPVYAGLRRCFDTEIDLR